MFLVPAAYGEESLPEVTTIVTNGGDDVSYQIPLTVSVVYDGVTYENVYATTNSVITFGRPDGTFWDYPVTPSISVESRDWWALPNRMPDTHFIINVSAGGFQVDGMYRPYGTFTGDTTSIIITAQIQTDGTVAYTYAVNGPLYGGERTGARLVDGTVVPLAEANIIQVEEAPVLEPEPIPNPTPDSGTPPVPDTSPLPSPTPTPSPVPVPEPILIPELSPIPQESIPELQPEPLPQPEPQPQPLPTPEPEVEPEEPTLPEPLPLPEVEPIEEPAPEPPIIIVEEESTPEFPTSPEETPEEETVTLENGVVLTQEQAVAIALLLDPAALLQELFTNPMAALSALGQVGADMSPEVREQSEKVVLSAIIASGIATQAAALATYRRKP